VNEGVCDDSLGPWSQQSSDDPVVFEPLDCEWLRSVDRDSARRDGLHRRDEWIIAYSTGSEELLRFLRAATRRVPGGAYFC
jgi:hypothetical protein